MTREQAQHLLAAAFERQGWRYGSGMAYRVVFQMMLADGTAGNTARLAQSVTASQLTLNHIQRRDVQRVIEQALGSVYVKASGSGGSVESPADSPGSERSAESLVAAH